MVFQRRWISISALTVSDSSWTGGNEGSGVWATMETVGGLEGLLLLDGC